MSNMRIIHTNVIDTSILSSSPACAAATPVENIQVAQRSEVARVAGAQSWTIAGEFMGAVSALCLVGHNLTGGATVRLRLYSDYAKSVLVYDSTALPVGTAQVWGNPSGTPNGGLAWGVSPWLGNGYAPGATPYFTIWFSQISTAVAFLIDISDPYNGDGYLQIGRVYLGDYWSPSLNMSYGMPMSWTEATKQVRTDGGSLRSEGYLPYRKFSVALDCLSEGDRSEFMEIARSVGLRRDVLISFFPESGAALERDYTAAVKFTAIPTLASPKYGIHATSIECEEI